MKRIFLILFTIHCSLFTAFAQCGIENTAFKSGEELDYDLYFNWKFVWMKVKEKATMLMRYGIAILTATAS